jgi:exopolysaccharide production protein ExoY
MKDLSIAQGQQNFATYIEHTPVSSVQDVTTGFYRRVGKRLLDVVFVLAASPAVLFILMFATLAVAADGGKPFYTQPRIGKNGKVFRMWKLRSMVPNAEQALEKHLSSDLEAAKEWAVYQKLKKDPRITRVGRLIRKTSLDELPQLWNVLRGDMSIVGPRPMMVDQVVLYPGTAYYALRPGVTGSWQVSERNNSTFEDRARFDSDYLRELSLWTDTKILFKTIPAVLKSTGH